MSCCGLWESLLRESCSGCCFDSEAIASFRHVKLSRGKIGSAKSVSFYIPYNRKIDMIALEWTTSLFLVEE